MKTNGREFKKFYNDPKIWGEAQDGLIWHDDLLLIVNGKKQDNSFDCSDLNDIDIIKIDCGSIHGIEEDRVDFVEVFKKWHKMQSIVSFTVECKVEEVDALKELIRKSGGKIVGSSLNE